MPKPLYYLLIPFVMLGLAGQAQPEDLSEVWPAQWITSAGPQKEFSVHFFRKTFTIDTLPQKLVVHTSGDMRYRLYINGQQVTYGPLTGDLRHWYYETTDLAPYLKTGKNVIAADVLNYGAHPPDARSTVQTGFLLCANQKQNRFLNTPNGWKALHNPAYTESRVTPKQVTGYYGGGSREQFDTRKHLHGWEQPTFNDTQWPAAIVIERAYAKTCKWASRWKLTPRTLPHETITELPSPVLRFKGTPQQPLKHQPNTANQPLSNLTIPANTHQVLVFDQQHQATAYPLLTFSGGANAKIILTYAEAPYKNEKDKGDRNTIDEKYLIGYTDTIIADGGTQRLFKPFWWRTYRYIKMDVITQKQPLTINSFKSLNSTYPFAQKANVALQSNNFGISPKQAQKIFEIGDRTMLACAHEHFMDCPYYEESQFEGDARIEMLVSYYNYGDPSLGKNAIEQFSWSVNDEGFLSARYPTNSTYFIPNFSLIWIGMLHDYMMIYNDTAFLTPKLSIMRHLLNYYQRHERPNATVKKLDYHRFVDWPFHIGGEAPIDNDGYSALTDLHYLMALQWAAKLEQQYGEAYFEKKYTQTATQLQQEIKKIYYNDSLGLFTDVPNQPDKLSQHTNAMAVLTGVVTGQQAQDIMKKTLYTHKKHMVQATLYWSFYLFEALRKANLGTEYTHNMQVWQDVMALNVTTWPETGAYSRSECHAWGSSPNYHMLNILAGIAPAKPGFKTIEINPALKPGQQIEASMPHPNGNIQVRLNANTKGVLQGTINLPQGTQGVLIWHGKKQNLGVGQQKIKAKP